LPLLPSLERFERSIVFPQGSSKSMPCGTSCIDVSRAPVAIWNSCTSWWSSRQPKIRATSVRPPRRP